MDLMSFKRMLSLLGEAGVVGVAGMFVVGMFVALALVDVFMVCFFFGIEFMSTFSKVKGV